jgi:hypothetical protein
MKQMGSPMTAKRGFSETEHCHQQVQNLLCLQRSSHPMPFEHTLVYIHMYPGGARK